MIINEFPLESSDKEQTINCVVWKGEEPPKAVLQIVHGMEEYVMRYNAQACDLVKRGWAVIGHDHLGHGKSGIHQRGHLTDREDGDRIVQEDIYAVHQYARKTWHDVPLFIMGHSMGSFLVRRWLMTHSNEVQGAIIMGSGWYDSFTAHAGLAAIAVAEKLHGTRSKVGWLTRLLSPMEWKFRSEGRYAWLSKNKANVAAFHTDPLRGFGFTVGAYRHFFRNIAAVAKAENADKLNRELPLLIISGSDDPVGGKNAVEKIAAFYRGLGCKNVSQIIMEGDRHELYFEDDSEETIAAVGNWLTQAAFAQNYALCEKNN